MRSVWVVAAFVALAGFAGLAAPAALAQADPAAETQPSAVEAAETQPLQRAIAEAEAVLASLEALSQELTSRAGAGGRVAAGRLEKAVTLEAELRSAPPGAGEVGAIFDRITGLLGGARDDLSRALVRVDATSEVPSVRSHSDLATQRVLSLVPGLSDEPAGVAEEPSAEAVRLQQLLQREEETVRDLIRRERELRIESVNHHGRAGQRLYELRLAALQALPQERREQIFSLSREGAAELGFELDVLRIAVRTKLLYFDDLTTGAAQQLNDLFAVVTVGRVLLKVLLVLVLWRMVQRRRDEGLQLLRRRADKMSLPRRRHRARVAVEMARTVAPWTIFLLGVAGLRWALGPAGRSLPLVATFLILAFVYGGYRLAVNLLVAATVAAGRHYELRVSPQHRTKIKGNARAVLRLVTVLVLVLMLCELQLGRGVLYAALGGAGLWIVGLTLLWVLVSWRRELVDAYLEPEGDRRWADLVRRTRDRWSGVLVLPLCFFWLCGRAVTAVGRDFALGFEQTRRATAYLFRRRIEQQAREHGFADGGLESLPAEVVRALDETVREDDLDALDHFPGLDRARQAVADWRRGEGGGSFLLTGDSGTGRRAWVDRFVRLEPEANRLVLDRRLLEPAEVFGWLGSSLLAASGHTGSEELASELLAGEPRLVVLEGMENLFLAKVNGYRNFGELAALAEVTRQRVFWLVSMEGPAWKHLGAAARELTFVRHAVTLPPWSEDQIRDLLRRRLAGAGFEASYADLLGATDHRRPAAARSAEGEKAYCNLLWDFTDGNPKVALHYFARSLVAGNGNGDELRVRLYRRPADKELVELGDEALFLLAAVTRHGSLTGAEAAAVTGYSTRLAGIVLARLVDSGMLAADTGRFRVVTRWLAIVRRVLRRHNILIS